MAKKWHIKLYAILLLCGGLFYGTAVSWGIADSGINTDTPAYYISVVIGGVLVWAVLFCAWGLSRFKPWSRKLTIIVNALFIIHAIFVDFLYKAFGSSIFIGPVCIFVIWYFSHPSVKLLFDEENQKVSPAPK